MSTSAPVCPVCGVVIPASSPGRVCPRCLLGFAATPDPEAPESRPAVPEASVRRFFGDYELMGEIARGGMGVVYKARQLSLDRIVAVKMVHAGALASASARLRFQMEAEAIARLDHPHIVTLHESGEHDGQLFFSMRLVPGGNLVDYLHHSRDSLHARITLLRKVAQAVEHAHARGILHRDLKPSNILIDENHQPQLTDFGLAKFTGQGGDLTRTESVIGTPNYMSPEQASGNHGITTASDVYSLGAILYEILTKQPPFRGKSTLETMRQVVDAVPQRPRELAPEVDRDLEVVCLKCLEKDPSRRYQTVGELNDEFNRWLAGGPVQARPVGRVERLCRWCRRQPGLAASLMATALLLVGVTLVSLVSSQRIRRANLETTNLLFQMRSENVESLFDEGKASEALASLALMTRARPGDPWVTERLTAALRYGSFSIPAADRVWHEGSRVLASAVLADDSGLITLSADGKVRRFDMAKSGVEKRILDLGEPVPLGAISADGTLIAIGRADHRVSVFDFRGELHFEIEHEDPLLHVLFGPGKRLITCDNQSVFSTWEGESGQRLAGPMKFSAYPDTICFSSDGEWMATSAGYNGIGIRRVATGERIQILREFADAYCSLAFNPDGTQLAGGAAGGAIHVWDIKTGRRLAEFGHPPPKRINGVRFSPDGKQLLSFSSDQTARLWDLETGKPGHILPHHEFVSDGVFSPDGRLVVTACHDNRARVWDVPTGKPVFEPFMHGSGVERVEFGRSADRILCFCYDSTVWTWVIRPAPFAPLTIDSGTSMGCAALSPDGQLVATATRTNWTVGNAVRLWETATTRPHGPPLECTDLIKEVEFSPDGRYLAVAAGREVRIWDVHSGQLVHPPIERPVGVMTIGFNPSGTCLIVGSEDHAALFDVAEGRLMGPPLRHAGSSPVQSASFSPDGRFALTVSNDGEVILWDPASQQIVRKLPIYRFAGRESVFSPSGDYLATSHGGGRVYLWETATGHLYAELPHESRVGQIAFNRDGNRLVTASKDGTARLWKLGPQSRLEHTFKHDRIIHHIEFSPSGSHIATASADGSARLWDTASGFPVTGLLRHGDEVITAEFSPEGDQLVTASIDGEVKRWRLAPVPSDAWKWGPDLAELVAGGRIEAHENFSVLGPEEVMDLRAKLTRQFPAKERPNLVDWYLGPFDSSSLEE